MQTIHHNEGEENTGRENSDEVGRNVCNLLPSDDGPNDAIDCRDGQERALAQCHAILVALMYSSDGEDFELSHEVVMGLIGAAYSVTDGVLRRIPSRKANSLSMCE